MREDQQECQQQMIEILEKVSEQVKKVENICSGSMPALDWRVLYSSCESGKSKPNE